MHNIWFQNFVEWKYKKQIQQQFSILIPAGNIDALICKHPLKQSQMRWFQCLSSIANLDNSLLMFPVMSVLLCGR